MEPSHSRYLMAHSGGFMSPHTWALAVVIKAQLTRQTYTPVVRNLFLTTHWGYKGHDGVTINGGTLTPALCILLNPNYALPVFLSSLHSFLWKFLLTHPWICLAALPLAPCHNTSLGAMEKLLSSDMWAENWRVKGERTSLYTTCQLVWRILIQHSQSGLQALRQRQSPVHGRDTHCNIMMQWKIQCPSDNVDLTLTRS